MKRRIRAIISVFVLMTIYSLTIWHVVHSYDVGFYTEMLNGIRTGWRYLPVLYNLGLMVIFCSSFGLLMNELTIALRDDKSKTPKRRTS